MTKWSALHLYYHEDLDRLITGLVDPLVRELRSTQQLQAWFFLRYWEGGNHLRLRLAAPTAEQTVIMIKRAWDRSTEFFGDCPSTRSLPNDQYRQLAEVFAAAEQVNDIPDQLPDNTVRIAAYRPEHERYGHGAVLRSIEDHFELSSEIALRLVGAQTAEAERLTACFDFLLAAWRVAMPSPRRPGSFADLLFDAWRLRLGPRIAPEREQQFAVRYQHQRDRLHARAAGEPSPLTAIWIRSLRATVTEIGPAIDGGSFRTQSRPGWADLVDQYATDTRVLAVLDLLAHLICNRLGINTVQESYLRFVAAHIARDRAADQATDHTPILQEAR